MLSLDPTPSTYIVVNHGPSCFSELYGKEDLVNDILDDQFRTPLHIAVEVGSAYIVDLLIRAGALAAQNVCGQFPWEVQGSLRLASFGAAARACSAQRGRLDEVAMNDFIPLAQPVTHQSQGLHLDAW